MKRIFSIVIIAVMLFMMMLPTNAAGGDILKGTPEIDGVLDEIYSQSVKFDLDNFDFYAWEGFSTSITAASYFLWDENFLYVCTVVNDSTISTAGEDYIKAEANPWQNDAVESWYYDVGVHAEGEKFKIHNDAFGYTMFASDGNITIDMDKAQYKTSIDGNKYTIEVALPFADLKAGREIGFALQVNDIANNDNTSGSASGTQTPAENIFKFSATEVTYPEVEVVEVAEPEAVEAETAAPVVTTTAAPQTSDNVIVFGFVMIIAATAVLMLRKKAVR